MFTKRRAFSLVELLITLTIFAVVAVLCVRVLVNSMASAQRIQSQVYLYSEANALMDKLAAKIERSAVDYEAYYLRYGYDTPETGWETANYGLYGQAFYHPGASDASPLPGPYSGIEGYKALCADGLSYYPDDCPTETPDYDDLDLNTGAHPFSGIDDFSGYTDNTDYMNAFCEATGSTPDCNAWSETVMQELILINGAGDERTVYRPVAFGSTTGQYTISVMGLTGTDSDYDGIVDDWVCMDDYTCTGAGNVPVEADFESITPSALNISSFYVYVAPFEDPYRAFAEEDVQIQPQVTIVMTVTLSDEYSNRLGSVPTITIQRTVSTGVYAEIPSYE
jgi:prepilin-type N-terminal cleavage/methylation domain-containing protein